MRKLLPRREVIVRFDPTLAAASSPIDAPAAPADTDDGDGYDLVGILAFGLGLGLLLYWIATVALASPATSARNPFMVLVIGTVAGSLLYVGVHSMRAHARQPKQPKPAQTTPAPARVKARPKRAAQPARRLAVELAVIVTVLAAAWFGLRFVNETSVPLAVVPTESMLPTLAPGDLLVIHGVSNADVHKGDVIVFEVPEEMRAYGPSPVVHRVVDVRKDQASGLREFQTKGDNNPGVDPYWVTDDLVLGRVNGRVPLVGHAALLLHSPLGVAGFIAAAGATAWFTRIRRAPA